MQNSKLNKESIKIDYFPNFDKWEWPNFQISLEHPTPPKILETVNSMISSPKNLWHDYFSKFFLFDFLKMSKLV